MTITMERWGKDHWSTFAYAETREIDHDGFLDMRHMRMEADKYGTRLKDEEVMGHTDLDCLKDAADLGMLTVGRATQRWGNGEIRQLTYRVEFTPKGRKVANALRDHKAAGGNFRDFVYEA